MIDLAVSGYAEEQVKRALHFDGDRRISFRYMLLDHNNIPKSPMPLDVAPGPTITLAATVSIKRTGRFSVKDNGMINWQADRIAPYFILHMPGGGECEWPLGVFLMPTARKVKGVRGVWYDVEAYDPTAVLKNDTTTTRTFFASGASYVDSISSLLSSAGITHALVTPSAQSFETEREWPIDTPKLRIIQELLTEINYADLHTDAYGRFIIQPHTAPENRVAEYTYAAGQFSVLAEGAATMLDDFDVPNVIIGVASSPDTNTVLTFVYENTDPANPVSIPARGGRRVTKKINFNSIASQDALETATMRQVRDMTAVYERIEFSTALMPHHAYDDVLFLQSAAHMGRYQETGWSMTLRAGAVMSHTGRRLVV